ncbi:MAG: DUF2071 domain-containing protein [Chitinophagaceae bacterium]|nr:DUF2071 domain-containing protein [Chitinophagaceae bacterium]
MTTLLTAEWTQLVVATFETDADVLRRYLPCKTELDDWNGKYYLSVLGFLFSNPVIAGIRSPIFKRFEEINLRFYVRYKHSSGWRKGVVFIREISPSPLIGLAAKCLYRENFTSLPLKHTIVRTADGQSTNYYWKVNGEWNFLKLHSRLQSSDPPEGSLEAYVRDRTWGYTRNGANRTKEFCIEHPEWKIYPGISFDMNIDVEALYGEEFAETLHRQPVSSFLMDGSRTKVSSSVLL